MTKKYSIWSNLRFLLGQLRQVVPRTFWLLFVMIVLQVLLPLIGVWLPGLVVKAVEEQGSMAELTRLILTLGLLGVAGTFLEQWGEGTMNADAEWFCQNLEDQLFYTKLRCRYEVLEDKTISGNSGKFEEAADYLWRDERYLRNAGKNLVMLGSGIFGFVVYLSILRQLHPLLLLLLTAATAISFLFANLGDKERLQRQNYYGKSVQRFAYMKYESADPQAGKDIRLYHLYPWIEERFARIHRDIRKDYKAIERKNFLSAVIAAAAGILMELCAYLYLTAGVLDGTFDVSEYVIYIGAVLGFTTWVRQVTEQLQKLWVLNGDLRCYRSCIALAEETTHETATSRKLSSVVGSSASDREKLSGRSRKAAGKTGVHLTGYEQGDVTGSGGAPCEIEFEHVSYHYPGSDVMIIRDLSFRIRKGERIALVGMNGAGKSTCVKLLCGLLKPTGGTIRVGGVSAQEVSAQAYFDLFATVFQEIELFPATIWENVTCLPKGEGQTERLQNCLRLAGLEEKVASFPEGAETLLVPELSEKAIGLSGGEQQRLLLARALYKDAPVLVLDEPTAALDPVSENMVYQQYFELTEGRTSIFISHRLASTRFCDCIFFMENGQITETGTHEELMSAGGKYAEAFEMQSRYYRTKELEQKLFGDAETADGTQEWG